MGMDQDTRRGQVGVNRTHRGDRRALTGTRRGEAGIKAGEERPTQELLMTRMPPHISKPLSHARHDLCTGPESAIFTSSAEN